MAARTMMMINNDALRVRRATLAGKAEWLRMRRLLWPDQSSEELAQEMESILANPLEPVFVVERHDGGLGGFLEAGTRKHADGGKTSPVGYVEGWFVDADLRGRGLGRALVAAAESWARGQGLHEMGSDTELANEVSTRAHLALGYRDAEHLIHFIKLLYYR
jgi:aminoglycoside 6'-N-acetyltransferase I